MIKHITLINLITKKIYNECKYTVFSSFSSFSSFSGQFQKRTFSNLCTTKKINRFFIKEEEPTKNYNSNITCLSCIKADKAKTHIKFEKYKEEYEAKIKNLELKNLEKTKEINRLVKYLERKRRIKHDNKRAIYILKHENFTDYYKVGICDDLTSRLSTYNTAAPEDYKYIYYKYTLHNSLIEKNIRAKFHDELRAQNKEWYFIEDGPHKLIEYIEKFINLLEEPV